METRDGIEIYTICVIYGKGSGFGLSKIARGFVKIHGGIRGGVMNPTVGE